jgi:PAS domain S-box-containing protein
MQDALAHSLATGKDYALEYRIVWPDSSVHWVEIRTRILRHTDGTPRRVIGVSSDITERKMAEADRERLLVELAAERARFKAAVENMPIGVGLVELDGTVVLDNPVFRQILVRPMLPSAVPGTEHEWIAFHPDGRPMQRTEFPGARALRGETVHGIEFLYRGNGGSRWLRVSGLPVRDASGRVSGALVVLVDVDKEKRAAEHQRLLIDELNHRVKNTLATVQSISTQTLRNVDTAEAARDALENRLLALSRAHDVLTRENWEGANLREVVAEAIAPYLSRGENRFRLEGPGVRLNPRMALAIAMALQELATNAVKYGALANESGTVRIAWGIDGKSRPARLSLRWTESGGPPVKEPKRRGFGSRLIERSLAQDLNGSVHIEFAPAGVACTVDAPIG